MEPTVRKSTISPMRTLLDDTSQLRDDVDALTRHAGRTLDGWRRYLSQRLESHPYATVGVVAGVGCVLGGGIPRPLITLLLGVGSRIAVDRVISALARGTTHTDSDHSDD